MGRVVWLQITTEKKRWMEKRSKGDWKWLLHQEREGWRNNRENEVCFLFFFPFIFISWRLITLQYWSGFCHTLTWINHGFTCAPHPEPPSRKWGFWRKIDLSVCVSVWRDLCMPAWSVTSVVSDSATWWTVARQAPLSTGFSRQKYWSGLLCPLQGIFPNQGSNPHLLHCRHILYHWGTREAEGEIFKHLL